MYVDFEIDEDDYGQLNQDIGQYFLFRVKENIFVVDAVNVEEIIEYQAVTKVPLSQDYVLGVTNVRGHIITVVDLSKRFYGEFSKVNYKTSMVIINKYFDNKLQKIALVVDEIYEVDALNEDHFEDTPSFGTPISSKYISFLTKYHENEVILLNIDTVLSLDEIGAMQDNSSQYKKEDFQRVVNKRIVFLDDDEDEEDEDFGLDKLIQSYSTETNQYLLFIGPLGQLYAKNISKIDEVVSMQEITVQKNFDQSVVTGMANIRGEMLPLVSFDKWIGMDSTDDISYDQVIIANYGKRKFGIIVQEIDEILTIRSNQMVQSADADTKSTFIATISREEKDLLCTIIDSDRLVMDCFKSQAEQNEIDLNLIDKTEQTDKLLLFADDSAMIRNMLKQTAHKLGIQSVIFENGKELFDFIKQTDVSKVGLVVTDLEMPVMDGKELIEKIRQESSYDLLNIVVYTNMANTILVKELEEAGATRIITKIDIEKLTSGIKELFQYE